MKWMVLALTVLGACEDPKDSRLTVTLDADLSEHHGDTIVYQGNGSFMVTVTAATDASDTDVNLQTLATELVVSTADGSSASVVKGALLRADAHTFKGTVMLSWPQGGPVTVTARVAGVERPQEFKLAVPRIALVIGKSSPNTGNATVDVPFCVVSSARGVSTSVHLEQATFSMSTDVDKTAALIRDACPIKTEDIATPAPSDLDVQSHTLLSLTSSSASPTITVTLASPTMTAPPLGFIDAQAVGPLTIPPKVASVTFVQPTSPASAQVGSVVTVQVKAVDANRNAVKGVVETYSSSAQLLFVPPTSKTNDEGIAITSFVMPDLMGGSLIVGATGADPLVIATAALRARP